VDAVGRVDTPVGPVVVQVDGGRLWSAFFGWEDATAPSGRSPVLDALEEQLGAYFAEELDTFDLPIAWERLGAFQHAVLERTAAIPYGETSTYGTIAKAIGRPDEARAVGGALRTNPWVIIVPCHRVVGAGGELTGYGGGPDTGGRLDVKAELLRHESRKTRPTLF
jgi:methylated-DNA-[protein]-cysteine S-methyltransferase